MARITVEDCLDHLENRFELVLVGTRRARQIVRGAEPMVPEENDKPTVIALREIAEGKVTKDIIDEIDQREQRANDALTVATEAMDGTAAVPMSPEEG